MKECGPKTTNMKWGGWRAALLAFVEYINNDEDHANTVQEETIQANKSNKEQKLFEDGKEDITSRRKNMPRDINLRLRFRVMQRDTLIQSRSQSPANDQSVVLHVDHIVPWSKGGETVMIICRRYVLNVILEKVIWNKLICFRIQVKDKI